MSDMTPEEIEKLESDLLAIYNNLDFSRKLIVLPPVDDTERE